MVRGDNKEFEEKVGDILKRVSRGELPVDYATDLISRYAKNFYARHPVHRRKRY